MSPGGAAAVSRAPGAVGGRDPNRVGGAEFKVTIVNNVP